MNITSEHPLMSSKVFMTLPNLTLIDDNFSHWVYSKNIHFEYFISSGYDIELFGSRVDPVNSQLKAYQDLFTYAFIKENIKPGSKILEIGGGQSRILNRFKSDYECWNVDKLEGVGNGPTQINASGFKLIKSYIGDFCQDLPNDYFDFAFSISVFEHVKSLEEQTYINITNDINRILKAGAMTLHSFDCIKKANHIWANQILKFFYNNLNSVTDFIEFDAILADSDLYFMSESSYNRLWMSAVGKTYDEFGSPFSYNFCGTKK